MTIDEILVDLDAPVTSKALADYQACFQRAVPEVLTQLLQTSNGGVFRRNKYQLVGERAVYLDELVPLESWSDTYKERQNDPDFPQGFVAFAVDIAGNEIGYLLSERMEPAVYWWESDPGRFTQIASSLKAFFAGLEAFDLYAESL